MSSFAGVLARLCEPKEVSSFAGVDQNIYLNFFGLPAAASPRFD